MSLAYTHTCTHTARVRPHLPAELCGGAAAGINARWRLYRYSPNVVYRPHVDGAWPGSGLDAQGTYQYDHYKDRWSRLTFVLYLNDDFTGGSTTFYTPSNEVGLLDAQGVVPRTGMVLCFPHGDTAGTLGKLNHRSCAPVVGIGSLVHT